jgi:ribonuclease HI
VSNNRAKALALFQGLKLFDARQIMSLIIIGDSTIIIKLMYNSSSSNDGKLVRIIWKTQKEANMFEFIEYCDVLMELNQQMNHLANMASYLDHGVLRTKNGVLSTPIY